MAVINLRSLVLCGNSVLCGGQATNLRLGTGYADTNQAPIGRSMQHPLPDSLPLAATAGGRKWQAFMRPAERIEPAVTDREVDAVVGGTSWSQVHAGFSAGRIPAFSACRNQTLRSSSGPMQGRTRVSTRKS